MVALNIETFVVCLVIAFLAGILVAKIKLKKYRFRNFYLMILKDLVYE